MMSDSPNSDRTHILLEDISARLELVTEGQIQLRSDLMSEIITRHESLEGKIQTLQLAINHNARVIQDNTRAIQDNARAIQDNGREIQGLHAKFDRLENKVDSNTNDIRDLKLVIGASPISS